MTNFEINKVPRFTRYRVKSRMKRNYGMAAIFLIAALIVSLI